VANGSASSRRGKLVFGTAADYPPCEFDNSNQELDGFDRAMATALGEALGVEVGFNNYAFDGLLSEVQLGRVDAAVAVLACASFPTTITLPVDPGGHIIGVQRGTTYQAWAQRAPVDSGHGPIVVAFAGGRRGRLSRSITATQL
jgi:ABC-type amino acid transport substrate-binding protein